MKFLDKKQHVKILSIVIIISSVFFFLGEMLGLYSISHIKNDLDTILSAIYTKQSLMRKLRIMLCFYLVCLLPLIHYQWFVVTPVVLFCRGYLLSCSLAAISYIHPNNIGIWFGIILSAGVHVMSLTVLSCSILYYLLVKRKYIGGNIASAKQTLFKSFFFVLVSIIVCSACELLIHI